MLIILSICQFMTSFAVCRPFFLAVDVIPAEYSQLSQELSQLSQKTLLTPTMLTVHG
jgi:hypothetical protein